MADEVCTYVEQSQSCWQHQHNPTHLRLLKLLAPERPSEFVVIHILGPLFKTRLGNKYVVVMTNRCSKVTRPIPTKATTATGIARTFINDWFIPYSISEWLLTDNRPQFGGTRLNAACTVTGTKLMTTTHYHSRANEQTKRYNKTTASGLQHFIREHQDD